MSDMGQGLLDAGYKGFSMVYAHALSHGDKSHDQLRCCGNSLTLLNLDILAHNGGDEDKKVIVLWVLYVSPY